MKPYLCGRAKRAPAWCVESVDQTSFPVGDPDHAAVHGDGGWVNADGQAVASELALPLAYRVGAGVGRVAPETVQVKVVSGVVARVRGGGMASIDGGLVILRFVRLGRAGKRPPGHHQCQAGGSQGGRDATPARVRRRVLGIGPVPAVGCRRDGDRRGRKDFHHGRHEASPGHRLPGGGA